MQENIEIKFIVDDKQINDVKSKIDLLKKQNKVSFNIDSNKINTDIDKISNTIKNNLGSSIKGVTSQLEKLTGVKFTNVISEVNKMKDIFTQTTSVFNNLSGLMKGSNLSSNININNNSSSGIGSALGTGIGALGGTFLGNLLNKPATSGNVTNNYYMNNVPTNTMSKISGMLGTGSINAVYGDRKDIVELNKSAYKSSTIVPPMALKQPLLLTSGYSDAYLNNMLYGNVRGIASNDIMKRSTTELSEKGKYLMNIIKNDAKVTDKGAIFNIKDLENKIKYIQMLKEIGKTGSINFSMLAGYPEGIAKGITSILPTLGSFTAKLLPIAGIFVGIAAAAGVTYLKIGQGFWDADKQIIKATGSLKGYENAVFDMASNSKYSIDALASSFSKLAPSLSSDMVLTNPTAPNTKGLEDLSIMIQRLKGLTGERINERDISGMFNKWSISAKDYKKTLDEVFYVHQQTGTSFNTIIQKITQNKAIFDEMGWSVQQSTLAVAEWEKQGYDASTVAMAFKKAANVMVDDYGVKDLSAGFAKLQEDLTGSKSRTDKLDEAAKFFGNRMSIDVVNAIIDGKIKLTEFTNVDFSKSDNSIKNTANKVKTLGGAWQGVINKFDAYVGKMLGAESAWKKFEDWGIGALDAISKGLDELSKHSFWDNLADTFDNTKYNPYVQQKDNYKSMKGSNSSGKLGDAILNAATPNISKNGYDINVANKAYNTARARGVSDKVLLALFEAGIVESNMQNLNYGDRDSKGYLQQRPSQGWGTVEQVRNVEYATNSFLSQAIKNEGKYSTSGKLAQGVQRSAFPERYDQVEAQAKALLKQVTGFDYTSDSSSSSSSFNSDVDLSSSLAEKQKAASDNVQTLKEKWQLSQKYYEENKNSSTLQAANSAYQTYAAARDSFNQSWMKDAEQAKEMASSMVEDENQRWDIQKEYQQFAKDYVDIQKQKYDLSNSQWEGNKKDNNLKAMANESYANYQSSRDSYNNTWLSSNEKIKAQLEAQIEDQQRLNSLLGDQKNLVDGITNSYSQLFKFSGAFDKLKIEKFSPGKLERRTNKNFTKWQKWTDDLAQLSSMGVGEETIYELRNMGVESLGIAEGLIKATSEQRNKITANLSNMSNIALSNTAMLVKHEVDGTIFLKTDQWASQLSKIDVEKIVSDALNSGINRFTR